MVTSYYLSIDIGTGSARAALVDREGRICRIAASEYEQIIPAYGWSEQRVEDWWGGACKAIQDVTSWAAQNDGSIEAVCACGQMHATVLVDENGHPARTTSPLWNDKRTADYVEAFEADNSIESYLAHTANPATAAWPAFKLQWIRDNDPEAYAKAHTYLAPKDYINLQLTGERAIDRTEAACSFLMDPATGDWSDEIVARLGLKRSMLPTIRSPLDILGSITGEAARSTGLREGIPVLVGGADYPVALLGSGVNRPGLASDVSGTSSIVTLVSRDPLLDPEISNVGTPEGNWGAFVLLESGGDAMRWARRAFHERDISYEEIVAKAAEAPAGADGLFFLPYLVGERLGEHRNSRAQFFGIAAGHDVSHLHRAVMEGVAFAVTRHMRIMEKATGVKLERVIASGGGAKTDLWLSIKASAYGLNILVPEEAECGLVGCAALAATATGQFNALNDAVSAFVRYAREITPDPKWTDHYQRMQPIFDRLYISAQAFYDDLDALAKSSSASLEG